MKKPAHQNWLEISADIIAFILCPLLTAYAYFYRPPELFPSMFLTVVALVGLRAMRRNETVSLIAFVILVVGIWILYPEVRWVYPVIAAILIAAAFILAPLMMLVLIVVLIAAIMYLPVTAYKKLKSAVVKLRQ